MNTPQKPISRLFASLASRYFLLGLAFVTLPALIVALATWINASLVLPILAGMVLISGIAAWLGAHRLVKPLSDLADKMKKYMEGEWQQRAEIDRMDEIGRIASGFNQMAEELSTLHMDLESKVASRTKQIRTAAEITQLVTSTTDLRAMLKRLVDLLTERFGYYSASVYLVDETGLTASLSEYSGANRELVRLTNIRLPVGSQTLVGWVTQHNQSRLALDLSSDPLYKEDSLTQGARSEVVLPISVGDHVLGALDVQKAEANAFISDEVTVLQTMANQVATSIQNFRLFEATQINLEETSMLYITSRLIGDVETQDEIYQAIANALKKTSYVSALFTLSEEGLKPIAVHNTPLEDTRRLALRLALHTEDIESFLPPGRPFYVTDVHNALDVPRPLMDLIVSWKSTTAAFIPIRRGNVLAALLVLGTSEENKLSSTLIQPYANLAELTATALEKVYAQQITQQRLNELQTLNAFSESISTQTSLSPLYQVIQETLKKLFGPVYFLLAFYDASRNTIEVPWMYDGLRELHLPPYPLGGDLTSIVIRSRQPLLLKERNLERLAELGVSQTEVQAQSWLGVPLIVGGEVIGALVVQDLQRPGRFSDEDQRLLSTISTQVAASIRNTRLLEGTRQQYERERFLFEITRKLRASTDMQGILQTTASELAKSLGARRARIRIGVDATPTAPEET